MIETKTFKNGEVNISYKRCGTGQPFIFVHGNSESSDLFSNILPKFATDGFLVFAPDTRSHGKSDKVKRLDYNDMVDDIAALIKHEQLEKPMFFGFSDGGIVGMLLAIKYPELLSKLFVAGINLTPKGIKGKWRFLMRLVHFFNRSDKFRLMLTQPNITAGDLKNLTTETIVFYAEKDMVKKTDSDAIIANAQNAKLVIVTKETHGSYIEDNEKLYNLLRSFCNK